MVHWRGDGDVFSNPVPSEVLRCETCGRKFLQGFVNIDQTLCDECLESTKEDNSEIEES